VREFINTAENKGRGWVDYKYPNPSTGKNEQKTSYLEFYEDLIIGCGAYKD
jgi:signal transduction histidine kinase